MQILQPQGLGSGAQLHSLVAGDSPGPAAQSPLTGVDASSLGLLGFLRLIPAGDIKQRVAGVTRSVNANCYVASLSSPARWTPA